MPGYFDPLPQNPLEGLNLDALRQWLRSQRLVRTDGSLITGDLEFDSVLLPHGTDAVIHSGSGLILEGPRLDGGASLNKIELNDESITHESIAQPIFYHAPRHVFYVTGDDVAWLTGTDGHNLQGLAWTTWVPTYGGITLGGGTVVARYVQIGDKVTATYQLTL